MLRMKQMREEHDEQLEVCAAANYIEYRSLVRKEKYVCDDARSKTSLLSHSSTHVSFLAPPLYALLCAGG